MNIHEIFDGFSDGILLLTNQGQVMYANRYALQICHRLIQDAEHRSSVPKEVWRICQVVVNLDNCEFYPEPLEVSEGEFIAGKDGNLRVRTHWIKPDTFEHPQLLAILEDRLQTTRTVAIAEAQQYGLTNRETEVWHLRRTGFTYNEIASRLYITPDTVKKHLKSIRAKREAFQWTLD